MCIDPEIADGQIIQGKPYLVIFILPPVTARRELCAESHVNITFALLFPNLETRLAGEAPAKKGATVGYSAHRIEWKTATVPNNSDSAPSTNQTPCVHVRDFWWQCHGALATAGLLITLLAL